MNDQPTGSALATLANITDLVDGRNVALAHWLEAFDSFHASTKAAALASIGGAA